MDGFGSITWWGFSEALDIQQKGIDALLEKLNLDENKYKLDIVNVLLVGAGDVRHVLKTIAHRYRWPKRKIHFYILENNLELYARDMLMLTVALEGQQRMGLQDKTELFLELFGNSLIRHQSCEYVEKVATEFIKMVTDFDHLEKRLCALDLSLLKFKERDMLEGIFKFWRNSGRNTVAFDKLWDLRLRQHLGKRYDAIPNVFDWDYNMKLLERGVSIMRSRDYATWRSTGVAFEIREGNYNQPNNTLISGLVLKKDGERVQRRGYWGDILVSPYIAYGIDCEDKSFFETQNKQHIKSSVDVSEFNLMSIFHEIQHQCKYTRPVPEDKKDTAPPQATLTEITEEDEEEESQSEPLDTQQPANPLDNEYQALPLEDVKISFLSIGTLADLHKKSKFQKLFNTIYISNSMVHLLTPELSQTFADKAAVVLETARFMIELNTEKCQEFVKKITAIAANTGCKVAGDPCDAEKDSFAWFTFVR